MEPTPQISPSIGFYMSCLKPSLITPDLKVSNIAEIDVDALLELGIEAVIFDVDNTLCHYHGTQIDQRVAKKVDELRSEFKTCILSNANSSRTDEVEQYFNIPVIRSDFKKPSPESFRQALSTLGAKPYETVMIGDRLLTDIAGANRVGIYTIKVDPLHMRSEPLHHTVVRGVERFLLDFYEH
ncbi:YqeG family HAD IIIA-type phosphatase [Candidatus Woesearchaeota archaeon]|nr:YqeG family HAD IIIA-type phosphatase [Candidatus Woesearchaeota archaeon]